LRGHERRRFFTMNRQNPEALLSAFPETLGALKRSPFGSPDRALRSVKDEMR